MLVEGRPFLSDLRFDRATGAVTWLESRPWEDGRQTLVRWTAGDGPIDISPPDLNVRTRVHEYGGAPYLVDGDLVIVSDFATGRLHRVAPDRSSTPITREGDLRYADLVLDESRRRLVAVREDHAIEGEPANTIVAIPLDGSGPRVLVQGADFYAAPRISPDGASLAWLRWDHPNMPWDGTELCLARLDADGRPVDAAVIAGSSVDWISQPRWSPGGVLHFVAEPTGWMNIQRLVDDRVEAVTTGEAEFAQADWEFGQSTFAFLDDGSVVAIGRSRGRDRLYRIGADGTNGAEPMEVGEPYSEMASLDVLGDIAVLVGASPVEFASVVRMDLARGSAEVLRRTSPARLEIEDISIPEPIEFPTTGGRAAFGLYYPPTNRQSAGPPGELPPLVVSSHGGPTSQAYTGLTITYQHFTSRGIAVLDVDYGGSTGYGREYRRRLEGTWGVTDVDDCVMGAMYLAARGTIDPDRMAVRGGSAAGFTTLAALAFRDAFQGGISYFGIGDLMAFAADTHKFESRYTDRLVGPLPAAATLYRERSPSQHVDGITVPVLVIQGAEDRIVPPSEAERLVAALAARGVPYVYLLVADEDHGFRKAENILRAYEAELSFLAQIFEFEPTDPIERIELIRPDPGSRR